MDTTKIEIQNLRDEIKALKTAFDEVSGQFYKNNFTSHQDFTKSCTFSSKLKIPVYTTLPTCEAGEIIAYSTLGTYKLMLATDVDTWTVVGTQS
jgi:hypothetical protein